MIQYFLYCRKSTDVEDKQVLSIEAQIAELHEFAKREGLNIVEEFIEKQSAKIPGRPVFNEMLGKIEADKAQGILSWHPDRLARNSMDGGKIIYLLDTGKLQGLKFPQFWFESTPQGKFMLSIAFSQSKYYVDSLAENTKRGLRQKVRRGEYPTLAPIGYINDPRTKTVIVDKKKAAIIKAAFELYVKGNYRLEDIAEFMAKRGIISKHGNVIHRSRAAFMLSNPFYCGLFRYEGEIHEGRHKPIIPKIIFDKAQEVLKGRGRPHKSPKNNPKPLCGLFRCGECGMMFTAEVKKGHTYYRCTKRSKTVKCGQPYIREESLDKELSEMLKKFVMPENWSEHLMELAEKDKEKSAESCAAFVQELRSKIIEIDRKLQRLLDAYLEQDIERENYREEKNKLVSERRSLEGQIARLERKQNIWLEPLREWLKDAQTLDKIALAPGLLDKKSAAMKIAGSNLFLKK
ncbi:MAG: recombinase family protein [Patescibacteria group bacterium]|nr:recombinase family protein [Patescibacteria group bacterium]